MYDTEGLSGHVFWELRGADGELKGTGESRNLITDVGDNLYASNGAGGGTITPVTKPTGMQLGTGANGTAGAPFNGVGAPTKSGTYAALVTYLPNSDHTFDAGHPAFTAASGGNGALITYKVTYAANEATSTSNPITEAVITNKTLVANGAAGGSAATAAQTIARVPLTGIGSKAASDTLTITWTHRLTGA